MTANVFQAAHRSSGGDPDTQSHGSVEGQLCRDIGIGGRFALNYFACGSIGGERGASQQAERQEKMSGLLQNVSLSANWINLGSRARVTCPKVVSSEMLPSGLKNWEWFNTLNNSVRNSKFVPSRSTTAL